MPLDLEQGKISVRLSDGVYHQLLADIEDFQFKKTDGSKNPNAFFNQLLPVLIAYRLKKREELREYLENNIAHCIQSTYREKVLNCMEDMFDFTYFNDNRQHYHRQSIHFRLNKQNILLMQNFFLQLEEEGQQKTSYLRNLFNEYASMRKDNRELLCFQQSFSALDNAIENELAVSCTYNNKPYSILPHRLILNYKNNSVYLFALDTENRALCHILRVCRIRDIELIIQPVPSFEASELQKLDFLMKTLKFSKSTTINLSKINLKA